MKSQRGNAVLGTIGIILFIAAIGGWIANIVKIFSEISDPITGLFILRAIGVVLAPLGAVLGYL